MCGVGGRLPSGAGACYMKRNKVKSVAGADRLDSTKVCMGDR